MRKAMRRLLVCCFVSSTLLAAADDVPSPEKPSTRAYDNRLRPVRDARPILADHPEFIQSVVDVARYEAAPLVDQPGADLEVRAWRWSYNARGIIEMPNRLKGDSTAIVVVHPWGIDDGQGWRTPEPAGCAFQCTLAKNAVLTRHIETIVNPFLQRLRPQVSMVLYSLPGKEDPIRKKIYRSVRSTPTNEQRTEGSRELSGVLHQFNYRGNAIPESLPLSEALPVVDYFRQFPGLDASDKYDPAGFWKLPVPVHKNIQVANDDVVIYDAEGYAVMRDFLKQHGIRHILLAGYNTDMCVCSTTAGYKNLQNDFNVFLVGDVTVATFPANVTPAYATNAAVSYAALNLLITQDSWIKPLRKS